MAIKATNENDLNEITVLVPNNLTKSEKVLHNLSTATDKVV